MSSITYVVGGWLLLLTAMVVEVESDDDPLEQRDTSLVPRPRPAFHRRKAGNEAKGIPYINRAAFVAVGSYTSK